MQQIKQNRSKCRSIQTSQESQREMHGYQCEMLENKKEFLSEILFKGAAQYYF